MDSWRHNIAATLVFLGQIRSLRVLRGLVFSLSFAVMLLHFYLFAARVGSSDPVQQICHHMFFLSLNLALPLWNLFRHFFGLPSIRLSGSGAKKFP